MTSAIGSRGFTLLELLAVLSIMTLISLAWPLAGPKLFPAQQLRNSAQTVAIDLRTLRMEARISGRVQSLQVDADGAGYVLGSERRDLYHGIKLRVSDETGQALHFFPDGSTDGTGLDLSLGARVQHLAVSSVTGRTTVQ